MTNKLTVTLPDGQEIEVEEGDRFYGKEGAIVFKAELKDDWLWSLDLDGVVCAGYWQKKIDFTRPAPDGEGWIKYYGTGQPVNDDLTLVEIKINGQPFNWVDEAYFFDWNDSLDEYGGRITHYRIVEESDGSIRGK